MTVKAAILLADGFEEIEAIVPFDLLNRAGIETTLVSVSNEQTVTGTNGLKVSNTAAMKGYDFSDANALIIPGGPGYEVLKKNPEVINLIRQFDADKDKVLGAICAGSSILGDLGLYKDKDYTCVPDLNGDFGGHYKDVHAVIDGKLVTGISVGGAFEFAFDLIRELKGKDAEKELKKATCYTL